ncbi:MAG: hypothetical protein ACRDSS_15870 [Actinocrinis sp.]
MPIAGVTDTVPKAGEAAPVAAVLCARYLPSTGPTLCGVDVDGAAARVAAAVVGAGANRSADLAFFMRCGVQYARDAERVPAAAAGDTCGEVIAVYGEIRAAGVAAASAAGAAEAIVAIAQAAAAATVRVRVLNGGRISFLLSCG